MSIKVNAVVAMPKIIAGTAENGMIAFRAIEAENRRDLIIARVSLPLFLSLLLPHRFPIFEISRWKFLCWSNLGGKAT